MISVIIPAFNAASTIRQQIAALAGQTYRGEWEALVADNGSTDGTPSIVTEMMEGFPQLRLIDASANRGASRARNTGAQSAYGSHLAFCDADDVVDNGWLEALVKALASHHFVSGAIDHDTLNPGPSASWHFRSHVTSAPIALRFMPYALSANMAISREAFDKAGGFPEDMGPMGEDLGPIGEDVALSWSLQLAGYSLHFEPAASVSYRHRYDSRSLWRQHYGYGRADPVLYRRFRHYGVPPRSPWSSLRAVGSLIADLPRLFSPKDRPNWVRSAGKLAGRLVGSIEQRVFYV